MVCIPNSNKIKNFVNQSHQPPPRKGPHSPYSKKQDEYYALHGKPAQLRTSSQLPARIGPFYAMDEPELYESIDSSRQQAENPFKGKQQPLTVWNRPNQSRSGMRNEPFKNWNNMTNYEHPPGHIKIHDDITDEVNMGDIQSDKLHKIKECFNAFKEKMQGIGPESNDKQTIRDLQEKIKKMEKEMKEKDQLIKQLTTNL